MRSGGGEVAQRRKGRGGVAQGVLSGLQDEERLPPGHPDQVAQTPGNPGPWPVRPKLRGSHGQPGGRGTAASAAGCRGTR